MKTDLYSRILLTIIAFCLLFNVGKELQLVPSLNANSDGGSFFNSNELLNGSYLRTNDDGSLNVRLAAADVIEVKPASNAKFSVQPVSSSTRFTVEPYSTAKFQVQPVSSSTTFKVEPYSTAKFTVTPASNAVFSVRNVEATAFMDEFSQHNTLTNVYPNPATNFITIVYNASQNNEYLTVCNLEGKIMEHLLPDPANNQLTLDTSLYPAGAYIYTFGGTAGKFIIKN
ncbi:MAG: T9SS type A sorting domain-containing protein [Candidatus Azobacteroides sp.]|nr:T9SS type A sorting domain-containing protein [Candidatus Azobacteroides sp.]